MTDPLDGVLDAYAKHDRLSYSILVTCRGSVLYERSCGVADPESGEPLTSRSSFNLASVTKPFTALCIMQLEAGGLLRLDEDIRTWLPDVPAEGVTVRHLLTHTCGLPEYFELYERYYPKNRILGNRDVLELLRQQRAAPRFAPGEVFEYCNTGYVLLALLIEAASGCPAAEYMVRNVLAPAGIEGAFPFVFGQRGRSNMVQGFEVTGNGLRVRALDNMDGTFGDGNLYASVTDLRKWADALAAGRLLDLDRLAEAFVPFHPSGGGGSTYGLGWRIDEEAGFAWHTGSWAGVRNYVRFGRGSGPDVFLLTNSSFGKRDTLVAELNAILSWAGSNSSAKPGARPTPV
jgi:CubicO group peptidase (beta-lactamase class C family)